ncbi:MAG: transcription-repair coupling factor, partial [Planctomycetaceae bacterium]|nr:transcription-repair coupling factor [Planctomycetaceae bacterium]
GQSLLIILPTIQEVDDFALDVANFSGITPTIFPAWESLPQEHNVNDVVFGARLRVIRDMESNDPPPLVITSVTALLQPVPPREERNAGTRTIKVGEELDPDALLDWLIERGFDRVPALEAPGEFSVHGGIVDLFPPDALDPVRIEFFGDEIESLRTFDVESQRKIDDLDEVTLTLLTPSGGRAEEGENGRQGKRETKKTGGQPTTDNSILASLARGSWVGLVELPQLMESGKSYLERLGQPAGLFTVEQTMAACAKFPTVTLASLGVDTGEATCRLQVESIERFTGPRHEVLHELAGVVARDERVLLSCHNEAEKNRLAELLSESEVRIGEEVQLCVGRVHRGFRLVAERLVVLSDHELFGRTELRRTTRRKKKSAETRVIDSFLELRENDLVVHLSHGIGRYRGMKKLEADDQMQEHLAIEFHGGVMVYVPVSLIHL